jgi:hypothetical protein
MSIKVKALRERDTVLNPIEIRKLVATTKPIGTTLPDAVDA